MLCELGHEIPIIHPIAHPFTVLLATLHQFAITWTVGTLVG